MIIGKVEKKHKAYEEKEVKEPEITPNYLKNPPFPYFASSPSYTENSSHHYINESYGVDEKSKIESPRGNLYSANTH